MNRQELLSQIEVLLQHTELNEAQKNELLLDMSNEMIYPLELLKVIANDEFNYSELHLHTWYSLLDGVSDPMDYIKKAKQLGHKGIAVTDHRVTHSWYKLRSATKEDIKPIFSCEIEVHEDGKNYHLVAHSMDNTGYRNLLTLVAWSHLNGMKGSKATITKELLAEHSEGIILMSACIGGVIGKHWLNEFASKKSYESDDNDTSVTSSQENITDRKLRVYNKMKQEAIWFAENFPNRFYLEVQDYRTDDETLEDFQLEFIKNQETINQWVYRIAKELNLPIVASSDVHYVEKEHAVVQDILLCINRGNKLSNPERFKFPSKMHYMKDKWEMLWRFSKHPEAVLNTEKIVDSCNITYQDEYLLPTYPDIPEGVSEIDFFKQRTLDGLKDFYGKPRNFKPLLKKFNCTPEELWQRIFDRATFEMGVFLKMGFQGYILVVSWCAEIARKDNVLLGHARGSAGGSIVAVAHKITDVCPLRYDLLFERFLNPDRNEMPDIDMDFQYELRGHVIEKVKERLGEDKVGQIVTFGRLMARAAIREIGRVLDADTNLVDKIAKLVPFKSDIKDTLEKVPEFQKLYNENAQAKQLIDYAKMIEGKPKNYSVHAAGVILSKDTLHHHVGLQKGKKAVLPVIQAEMDAVDGLRLVKQDFLGVRILSVIAHTIKLIAERHGIYIDPYDIPQDDPKTYEMLKKGESIACFQLESSGMRQLMKDMQVDCLEDVVDLIALYRPGVLSVGMHNEYVKNKNNPNSIQYLHDSLIPTLHPTKGILIYQEQAMFIVHNIAGFSMSKADKLRKAISKKKEAIMNELHAEFIDGCERISKIPTAVAEEIWHLIDVMSKYSFNKSHSVGYAFTSIDTAYLKANFPLEYMVTAISKAVDGKSPKVPTYIEEAKRMGFKILTPDINLSMKDFSIIGEDGIMFGLAAIKDVGKSAYSIIEERNANGPFKSVADFRRRCPECNKSVLTALIKAGCFDCFGHNRNAVLLKLDDILKIKKPKEIVNKHYQQLTIAFPDFDMIHQGNSQEIIFPDVEPPTLDDICEIEDDLFGIYITHHPLSQYKDKFEKIVTCLSDEFMTNLVEGQKVIVGGLIKEKKKLYTKKDSSEMAKYTIDDISDRFEVISFPRQYANMSHFEEKQLVIIKGSVQFNEKYSASSNEDDDNQDETPEYSIQIVAEEMMLLSDYIETLNRPQIIEDTTDNSLISYLKRKGLPIAIAI